MRKELKRLIMPTIMGLAIGIGINDWFIGFLIGFIFWMGTADKD